MISCTDFIPVYNELFLYLEEHYGRAEIDTYWRSLFKPGNGSPLVNFVRKEGIRGCFTYWSGTLNEEAADFSMYLNEKRGFFKIVMHRCPSKGRLLDLQAQIGVVPFRDYCLHCDSYRAACAEVGLEYIYDFQNADQAGCSILIYDPKIFDGRIIMDGDTVAMHRNAADNPYFHPGFHSSLSRNLHHVGEHYGQKAVREILSRYTRKVVLPLMGNVTLSSIEEKILADYAKEHCPEAVHTHRSEKQLLVTVDECPAVRYMRERGLFVSPWYSYTTRVVMEELAQAAGCDFAMDAYDEATGAAAYRFTKK